MQARQSFPPASAYRLLKTATDQATVEAVEQILRLSLAGAGAGAGIRGLMGLRDLLAGHRQDPPHTIPLPAISHIPRKLSLPELTPAAPMLKAAQPHPPLMRQVASTIAAQLPAGWATGASDPKLSALGMPLTVLGTGASLYGGYKLVDWLLKRRQTQQSQRELDRSRQEYLQTLNQDYADTHTKTATATAADPYAAVTALAGLVKTAGGLQSVIDALNQVGGMYNTGVALTGLGTAVATYNFVKNRSQAKLLEKALKRRSQAMADKGPQSLLAVPDAAPGYHYR